MHQTHFNLQHKSVQILGKEIAFTTEQIAFKSHAFQKAFDFLSRTFGVQIIFHFMQLFFHENAQN